MTGTTGTLGSVILPSKINDQPPLGSLPTCSQIASPNFMKAVSASVCEALRPLTPPAQTSDQPVLKSVPVCSHREPEKLANAAGLPWASMPAWKSLTPPAQTSDQPALASVPTCSQSDPEKLANTVSACVCEALIPVTPLSQTSDQPPFGSRPTCSH